MSCICQYMTLTNNDGDIECFELPKEEDDEDDVLPGISQIESVPDSSKKPVSDDVKMSICVSELVDCRAENWLLKKKLQDTELTILNLEQLMSTIVNKQRQILGEVIQLRKRNRELQTECNMQREYHAMERDALIKEMHEVKTRSTDRMSPLVSSKLYTPVSNDTTNEQSETETEDEDEVNDDYEEDEDEDEDEEKRDEENTDQPEDFLHFLSDGDGDSARDSDDVDDEDQWEESSKGSTAPSSVDTSIEYSTDSENEDTEDNDDGASESEESEKELFVSGAETGTESESD